MRARTEAQEKLVLSGGPAVRSLSQRAADIASMACVGSVEIASAVTTHAVRGWWAVLVDRLGASGKAISIPSSRANRWSIPVDMRWEAQQFGTLLADLAVPEAVAEFGKLYSRALPPTVRGKRGIFYTPPMLVKHLLDRATEAGMDWQRGKAISPACGGGQFLVEDARRMVAAMGAADPAIVVASVGARLRGWDIDPFACWLSQVAVEALILPHVVAARKRLPSVTECRDSLMGDWSGHEGAYDLVNENPAFGKVKDTPLIRDRFARALHGHPNTYALFADLGLRLAKADGGILTLLTPTSFLGGQYFRALRRTLAEEAPPVSLDLVESRADVFPDVLQEVVLSAFVRGQAATRATCTIVHVEPTALQTEGAGELRLPADPSSPWVIARDPDDATLVAAMQSMPTRLADWGFKVSTGPLVWNRAAKIGRLHDDAGEGRYPIVWSEAVGSDGRFVLRYAQRAHKAFYEAKEQTKGRGDANLVRSPCLLLQRTTAKEQRRRLIGALMPASLIKAHGAVAVENHLNMVRPTCDRPAVSLKSLAAFFASGVADRAIRCINGSVALSASELEAMPLPSAGDLTEALAEPDPESALRRLYGIMDEQGSGSGEGVA